MKFLKSLFSKKTNKKLNPQLSKQQHQELVSLCEKALTTKKLTVSKSNAIYNWFNTDFVRALDPIASELFSHCCSVEDSGEVCLTQSMRDCITHIVNTSESPIPRLIPESTNEFEPFQEVKIKYSNKNGELSDRNIIFIKSEIRQVKEKKTDIYAICKNSQYALQFVKERIVSFEIV